MEKYAIQIHISPAMFVTINENTKQTSEWSYVNRDPKGSDFAMSITCAVIAVEDITEKLYSNTAYKTLSLC
jgi:hypothetical protein